MKKENIIQIVIIIITSICILSIEGDPYTKALIPIYIQFLISIGILIYLISIGINRYILLRNFEKFTFKENTIEQRSREYERQEHMLANTIKLSALPLLEIYAIYSYISIVWSGREEENMVFLIITLGYFFYKIFIKTFLNLRT